MKKNNIGGTFIVIEGMDGIGKTTLAVQLKEDLIKQGYKEEDIVITREPYSKEIKKEIMDNDLSNYEEQKLFTKDRELHLKEVVKPALKEGKIVICDRYMLSSIVYQKVKDGLDAKTILTMSKNCLRPDYQIVLTAISPKSIIDRLYKNNREEMNKYDYQKIDFHEKINQTYMELKDNKIYDTQVAEKSIGVNYSNMKVEDMSKYILKNIEIKKIDNVEGGIE